MQRASFTFIVPSLRSRHLVAAAVTVLLPALAFAQPCHGTTYGTSVAYERGTYQLGSSNGANLTYAGKRFGAAIDGGARDYSTDFSGSQVNGRLSLVLGSSRFQVCPGLRFGYSKDNWEYEPGSSVDGTRGSVSGGINFGLEQHVGGDFSVIPFAGAFYRFSATGFTIGATNSENVVGGDTVSVTVFEYGLVGRWRWAYGGIAMEHGSDSQGLNPDVARWIIGVSLKGIRSKNGNASSSSKVIDKPRR